MSTVNLSARGLFGNAWAKPLIAVVLVAIVGLGVKMIWFDQAGYLVATNQIPVGANLAREQWRVVHASLGQLGGQYLDAGQKPQGFALQTIESGQLVTRSSVGKYAPETVVRLVISNKTQLGSGIRSGAIVSIWSSQKLAQGLFDTPKRLVTQATVGKIIKTGAVFGSKSQQVEVLVDPAQTSQLLMAVASDSPIFLVAQE